MVAHSSSLLVRNPPTHWLFIRFYSETIGDRNRPQKPEANRPTDLYVCLTKNFRSCIEFVGPSSPFVTLSLPLDFISILEPLVELCRVATHVGVSGLRHLQVLAVEQPSRPLARFGLLKFRHLVRQRSEGRSCPRRPSHPAHGLQPRCATVNGGQWAKRICHRGRHPQTHEPLMDQASRRRG